MEGKGGGEERRGWRWRGGERGKGGEEEGVDGRGGEGKRRRDGI